MGQDVLMRLSRHERRDALKAEQRRRKSGDWPPWETLRFPRGTISTKGWAAEFETVHRNWVFSVLDRALPCGVRHLAITSLTEVRPTWWEMQRIKNELAGETATAVEVYPPQSEVIDQANMFHLWVLPQPLSFSLYEARQGKG